MAKQIFVNLAVKDLKKSVAFFKKIGFSFNPKFTDDNATCMIIGEDIFVMLLVEKFFKTFTTKEIIDAKKNIEVINAISLGTKAEVDNLVKLAISAGAKEPRPATDHGWMYTRMFEDLDGHVWEFFYMDESKMPK